jgi:heme oxygenase
MMMAATDGGPRGRLRQATSVAHARVDACFPRGLLDAQAYRRYLRGMHALATALDAGLAMAPLGEAWREWRLPQRVDWLREDLAAIGAAPLAPGPALSIAHAAEAAGALYVLEGSALGATQLLLDAQSMGFSEQRGARFLHAHGGEQAGARWMRYLRNLESARFDLDAERAMIGAAARTFAYAEHEFLRAARLGA